MSTSDSDTALLHRRADESWQVNKTLAECNEYLFRKKEAADVTFSLEYKDGPSKDKPIKVHAHRVILLARSPVFHAMFSGQIPVTEPEIKVDDVDPDAFSEMLRYVYCDVVDLNSDNVLYVMYASKKNIIPMLTDMCGRFLEKQLTPANVCSLLEHSIFFNDKQLIQQSLEVFKSHSVDAMDNEAFAALSTKAIGKILDLDVMSAEEVDIFVACLAWASAACAQQGLEDNSENQRKVLGDLLYKIRFPTMTLQQYADIVVPTGILNDSEGFLIFQYFVCQSKPDTGSITFNTTPRKAPVQKMSRLFLPGPYSSKTVACKYQATLTLFCLLSKDVNVTTLLFHDYVRTGHDYSKFEVRIIQGGKEVYHGSNDQKDIESFKVEGNPFAKFPVPTTLLKQGKFKIQIDHYILPNPGTGYSFVPTTHVLNYGESENGFLMADKEVTLKIGPAKEMPLFGVLYSLA